MNRIRVQLFYLAPTAKSASTTKYHSDWFFLHKLTCISYTSAAGAQIEMQSARERVDDGRSV